MAEYQYSWDQMYQDIEDLRIWMSKKPKWWQFWKFRKWLYSDPRKNWR